MRDMAPLPPYHHHQHCFASSSVVAVALHAHSICMPCHGCILHPRPARPSFPHHAPVPPCLHIVTTRREQFPLHRVRFSRLGSCSCAHGQTAGEPPPRSCPDLDGVAGSLSRDHRCFTTVRAGQRKRRRRPASRSDGERPTTAANPPRTRHAVPDMPPCRSSGPGVSPVTPGCFTHPAGGARDMS